LRRIEAQGRTALAQNRFTQGDLRRPEQFIAGRAGHCRNANATAGLHRDLLPQEKNGFGNRREQLLSQSDDIPFLYAFTNEYAKFLTGTASHYAAMRHQVL